VGDRFAEGLRPHGRAQQAITYGIVVGALWGVFNGVQNGLAWGMAAGVVIGVVSGLARFALASGIPRARKYPLVVAVLLLLPVVILVLVGVWTG
jgi:hypothetical protein